MISRIAVLQHKSMGLSMIIVITVVLLSEEEEVRSNLSRSVVKRWRIFLCTVIAKFRMTGR